MRAKVVWSVVEVPVRFTNVVLVLMLLVSISGCGRTTLGPLGEEHPDAATAAFGDAGASDGDTARSRDELEQTADCADLDRDTFFAGPGCPADTPVDCDDFDPTRNPGVVEVCANTIDDNCDQIADCLDPLCGPAPECDSAGACVSQPPEGDTVFQALECWDVCDGIGCSECLQATTNLSAGCAVCYGEVLLPCGAEAGCQRRCSQERGCRECLEAACGDEFFACAGTDF